MLRVVSGIVIGSAVVLLGSLWWAQPIATAAGPATDEPSNERGNLVIPGAVARSAPAPAPARDSAVLAGPVSAGRGSDVGLTTPVAQRQVAQREPMSPQPARRSESAASATRRQSAVSTGTAASSLVGGATAQGLAPTPSDPVAPEALAAVEQGVPARPAPNTADPVAVQRRLPAAIAPAIAVQAKPVRSIVDPEAGSAPAWVEREATLDIDAQASVGAGPGDAGPRASSVPAVVPRVAQDLSEQVASAGTLMAATAPVAQSAPGGVVPGDPAVTTHEVVWRAFRSEASARGFAAHLSRLVGHEFTVLPRSLAGYQVAFQADTPERVQEVRALVAAVLAQS